MTLPPRANEIPDLVRRLGSRRPALVDGARARLAIIGARAVEALIEALEGDDVRVRLHAMGLLALIGDPRGRGPLIGMLLDRDPRQREAAARCLGRFPAPDAVAALERLLVSERKAEIRVAAAHALAEQYAGGQEGAVRKLVPLLVDPQEDQQVREAAFALLPSLPAGERRSLLRRLRQDPSPEIARRAVEFGDEPEGGSAAAVLRSLLADLGAEDYPVWNEAVHRLAGLGAPVVPPLVEQMRRRSHEPEFCTRAGIVLRALGPRRARGLADALETVEEPLPLQVLIEVAGALGEKSVIYRLKDVLERIRGIPSGPDGFDPWRRVRAKAHLELARVGSRVAAADLRDCLACGDGRLEAETLAAVGMIGKRDEIPDLLRAWLREDRFMQERIGESVRAIVRRERIRRNDPVFTSLGAETRKAAQTILGPGRAHAPRSRV